MRDKHIHIVRDSELLKTIYRQVDDELVVNSRRFRMMLLIKFLVYFPVTILSYLTLYHTVDTVGFVLAFILYGFLSLLFAFNFSHDFSHNTIFQSRKLNNLCFILIYSIVGAHAEAWKQRHIQSHHYAPNVDGYDSDLAISRLIRVIPGSPHAWYHRFQHLYALLLYTTYSLFWIFIKDMVILYSKDDFNQRKNFQYHFSFWMQKVFYLGYILVLPLIFSLQPWYIVIIGFLMMHLFQSLFLLLTFFMTHHVEETEYPDTDVNGNINTSWLMNQVRSSNDMHPFSPAANFILGGFNNHIAHHLFPHIHHIYYPRLSKMLYSILEQHDIKPNHTTYWGGIVSHLRLLKKMGRRVG